MINSHQLSLTNKRWNLPDAATDDVRDAFSREVASRFQVSKTVAQLIAQRGINSLDKVETLLRPRLEDLHDPSLMLGVETAVKRITQAIEAGEKILIYGDYDVDGTTGTVVMRRALEILGAETGYHIPHRFTEGYGINTAALERAKREGYSLVISVDCGIRAYEPLTWARDNNLDCIVTDHHLPDETHGQLPAVAVLNPNQAACNYPDKNLAGVGVAFKLAHALLRAKGKENLVHHFLKLVAIGTVADIAPLIGENRAIVKLGLADLPTATNCGLRALMEVAGCIKENVFTVDATDIGFRLGPRINAAGRMDAARQVVELFEAREISIARTLAQRLDELNRERQIVQKEIVARAIEEMESSAGVSHVAVIAGKDWHRGVIGLAASKIAEKYNRPSIVISLDDGKGHGSARSIEGYHLLSGLESCSELFEQFGGHAAAAGLAIKEERIADLRIKLNAHAAAHFGGIAPVPSLNIDFELAKSDINVELVENLKQLEPFGAGWRQPLFYTRDLTTIGEPRIMKERHLKLFCQGANGARFDAVWWSGAEILTQHGHNPTATIPPASRIKAVYTIGINEYRGERKLQLILQDVRC